MYFGIGSQRKGPELIPAPKKTSKGDAPRGQSLDRPIVDPVISPMREGPPVLDFVPIHGTSEHAPDSASSLRTSVMAHLEAVESSDEESKSDDVDRGSEEARQSIAQLIESIGDESASDSVARVLAAQKIASRIFYPEKKGPIHEVKLSLTSLPNELYGLAVPTDKTVVLDSETGQKDKASLKLLNQIMAVLSNSSSNNRTLLDKPYSGLSKQDKGKIDASVASFLDKVQEKTAPNSPTLRDLLTRTSQGLSWKLAHVGDQGGLGGRLTANHLGVERDNALFSRSARFNSIDKMKAVLEGAAWQESQKLTRVLKANSDSAIAVLFNEFDPEASITKKEAHQLNTFFRQEGVHLYIETSQYSADEETRPPKLCMMTNLISAMDSTKKDEVPFWASLVTAYEKIPTNGLTFADNGREIHIEKPLLTESSQSSFAAGTIAQYNPSDPITTKLDKRDMQVTHRLTLLKKQADILGSGYTFTDAFDKMVCADPPLGIADLKDLSKNLSGAEKAFVDYMINLKDKDHQGDFDRFFTPATNVMTLEMGDVAFAELCGLHDHVSCKSGQDRTLTLTALRLAIAEKGWPTQPEAEYKSKFAIAFFATVARQGTSVVAHARGPGGVLKFNLGDRINEQPIPGALFRYMESDLESIKQITQDKELRDGLKSIKMPEGPFQLNVHMDDVMPEYASPDDKRLLSSFFTKRQSQGKRRLLDLFQQTVSIDRALNELQNPRNSEAFDDGKQVEELTAEEKKKKLQAWEKDLKDALTEAESVQPKRSTQAMVQVKIKTAQTTQLKAYFKQYATRVLVKIQAKRDEKFSLYNAIEKHKASTESQLEVALTNFELAAKQFKIDPDDITKEVAKLRAQKKKLIRDAYQNTDLATIDRQFRDKQDDFGLTATLKKFLAESGTKTGTQRSKEAMKKTKSIAIDIEGEKKSAQGIQKLVILPDSTRYTTEIQKKTRRFVSSASNQSVGNTAGNLNLQTLKNAADRVLFQTLRHAALTVKPNTKIADPLNPFITAADRASIICKLSLADAETALKTYGLKASTFKGRMSGKLDEKSLAKQLAKQCGLLNKALDVAKAAWEAKNQPNGPVTITSLSLMTPDRPRAGLSGKGGEIGKLNDQVEAFGLLAKLTPTDLKNTRMFSEKGASLDTLKFEVMTFNFGVNEGESLGATHQKRLNDEAIEKLRTLSNTKTAALEAQLAQLGLRDSAETARLTVERDTVAALKANIDALYTTYTQPFKYDIPRIEGTNYNPLIPLGNLGIKILNVGSYALNSGGNLRNTKGWWRADQAYNLTAKIAFLTELCDGVNTCNCASGKDRTGMHVQNSLNYAALMRARMEVRMGDLKFEQMDAKAQVLHLATHHFDVLEATATESVVTEVTDFVACIKKGQSLTAEDLSPFLKDGDKALNLSALENQAVAAFVYPLKMENLTTLDLIKTRLLVSGQGALSSQSNFMGKALLKFKEKSGDLELTSTWEMMTALTSKEDEAKLHTLQLRNRAFMLETGQHEVQEWNTGSPGYKLYSSWQANLVTRGGQTEKYFMHMFGLTAAEVAEWVTMQSEYNHT